MTIVITGGTAAIDGNYTVRTFTATDTLTITSGDLTGVNYLQIAKGGSVTSQGTYRGGGGAGGVIQVFNTTLVEGSYLVEFQERPRAGNVRFNGQTAVAGGSGGWSVSRGGPGGSGGGCGVAGTTHPIELLPGNGINGQGCRGGYPGLGGYPPGSASGGGGYSTVGGDGGDDFATPGNGGDGIESEITGISTWYAGGGAAMTGGICGISGKGRNNWGGGGGYENGQVVYPQPGVLILRYLTP